MTAWSVSHRRGPGSTGGAPDSTGTRSKIIAIGASRCRSPGRPGAGNTDRASRQLPRTCRALRSSLPRATARAARSSSRRRRWTQLDVRAAGSRSTARPPPPAALGTSPEKNEPVRPSARLVIVLSDVEVEEVVHAAALRQILLVGFILMIACFSAKGRAVGASGTPPRVASEGDQPPWDRRRRRPCRPPSSRSSSASSSRRVVPVSACLPGRRPGEGAPARPRSRKKTANSSITCSASGGSGEEAEGSG